MTSPCALPPVRSSAWSCRSPCPGGTAPERARAWSRCSPRLTRLWGYSRPACRSKGPARGRISPMYRGLLGSHWRREVLRTSLWFVPAIEVAVAIVLFVGTLVADRAAYHGDFGLPGWVISG